MRIILNATVCSLMLIASAWGTVRYVDSTASGANNGTSWANAYTNLTLCANVAVAGDTNYISGGSTSQSYFDAELIPNNSGTVASPITWMVGQDAGHNGTVILDGGGTNVHFWAAQLGNRRDWHTWDGNVGNSNHIVMRNYTSGVLMDSSQGMTWRRIDFRSASLRNNGGTTNMVCFCNFWATNMDGAAGLSGQTIFAYNTLYQSRAVADGLGDDGLTSFGDGSLIFSNSFIGVPISSYTAGQHQDGCQTWGSNIKIFGNYFLNLGNSAVFFAPFPTEINITNVMIYNNLVERCSQGLAVGNNGAGTITTNYNVVIANNTLADINADIFRYLDVVGTSATNVWVNSRVDNNVVANSGGITLSSSLEGLSNVVLTASQATNSFTAWSAAADSSSVLSFTYDFHLAGSASLLISQGTNLSAFFTTDYNGNSRPAAGNWTIGAFEAAGSSGASPASSQTVLGWGKYGWMRVGN